MLLRGSCVRRTDAIRSFEKAQAHRVAWRRICTTRAQQQGAPVVGFLSGGSPGAFGHLVAAFRRGLNETGYVEHRNVGIEYAWAEGQIDRLPALANDLVGAQVSVILAGGPPAALAAKRHDNNPHRLHDR
jgi:ABC-type uncharacterized transport system substrate-binding protein